MSNKNQIREYNAAFRRGHLGEIEESIEMETTNPIHFYAELQVLFGKSIEGNEPFRVSIRETENPAHLWIFTL